MWWGKPSSLSGGYGGERERFWRTIPEADVMIFDEAHQLPDIATSILVSHSPVDNCSTWQKTSHRLPHRIKRHPAVTKVRGPSAQSAQDFRLQLGEPGYRGNRVSC